ncbi:MAG TPA: TetR family transcriptional regulator [Trebonia sp.]|nr:TetR family transcriptional regulator [Trebonia sp.]
MTEATAPGGLRERKKARTRAAIREHALRLFREHGFSATTVEQIAAAAEVSPSTFFRYFPTKEDLVLQDDMDSRLIAALERQPPGLPPVPAIRAAARETWDSFTDAEWDLLRQSTRLMVTEPDIRARAMNEFARSIDLIAGAIARRSGHDPGDLPVRALAGAVIGVIMSVTMPQHVLEEAQAAGAGAVDLLKGPESARRIDEALALLEAGLPL